MRDVKAVAAYICSRYQAEQGERIDEMKLHKLLYFAQRESLIRSNEPLFEGDFQGWRFGPVMPEIRMGYRDDSFGAPLTDEELGDDKAVLDYVFDQYAEKESWSLSRLTHGEISWKKSRAGIDSSEISTNVMPLEDIRLDADRMRERREMLNKYGLL